MPSVTRELTPTQGQASPTPEGPVLATATTPAVATQIVGSTKIAVGPGVMVGKALFPVEIAVSPAQRQKGLSGRPSLPPATAMLFVFEEAGTYRFWMKGMGFPLDIVWIGPDCTVVDMSLNALPPTSDQGQDNLPLYSPTVPSQFVLEINAGEAYSWGLSVGDRVELTGGLAGKYSC